MDGPALLPHFMTAVRVLTERLNLRGGVPPGASASWRPGASDHQARVEERRRIARELHDRVGESLCFALRQLELSEISDAERGTGSLPRTAMARESLVEAMDRLRAVLSDLREDPVMSLEKALTDYIESRLGDADVRLRVSGDETYASPRVIDEAYLIIREAIRNALAHGAPELVLIGIDLAPHELHASVDDDGCGFVPADHRDSGTAGLTSMRERAVLIGGRLTVSSRPGRGTRVELLVPLPRRTDERTD